MRKLPNFYKKVTELPFLNLKDLRFASPPLLSLSEKLDTQESVFPILSANMLKPYSAHFDYNA